MNRIIIYPYKMSSQSSKRLAEAIKEIGHNVLRVYPDRTYRPLPSDLILNWGCSSPPNWDCTNMINSTQAAKISANKKASFIRFHEYAVPTLIFTGDKLIAEQWTRVGHKVFCRTLLNSHSGRGIVTATRAEQLVDAPLYTQEFKKTHEFRLHVWGGEVFDVQEKRKRDKTGSKYDVDVWNHGNDFVFARQNITVPECVKKAAVDAVMSIGLDFGAVDIGYNNIDETCAVFEVNTAPGITNTTIAKYAEKVNELARN